MSRKPALFSDDLPLPDAVETVQAASTLPANLAGLPGIDMFSEDEIAEIRKLAKEKVEKTRRDELRKIMLDQFEKIERTADDPDEEKHPLNIALPKYAATVVIDGVTYFNGHTVMVSKAKLDSLREIVQNAWKHEKASFGHENPNVYMRSQAAQINGLTNQVTRF